MITTPTVLVLGAGASSPYGFPLGYDLFREVCGGFIGNTAQSRQLCEIGFQQSEITAFAKDLQKSACRSVDEFLEERKDLRPVGKGAIATVLVAYEHPEKLFNFDNDQLKWYSYLFSKIKTPLYQMGKNQLTIITYNYDRSLEFFLLDAIQSNYNVDEHAAMKALLQLNIIHLHGKMGDLPIQSTGTTRAYSNTVTPNELKIAANGIKIIHEHIENEPQFKKAWNALSGAKKVLFLGFGYHAVNLARLNLSHCLPRPAFWGTCEGMIGNEIPRLSQLFNTHIRLYPVDIKRFLRETCVLEEDVIPLLE